MPTVTQYLGMADLGRAAGLQVQTIRDLRIRGRLPEPDAMVGVHPGWLPETVERWLMETGRGHRGAR